MHLAFVDPSPAQRRPRAAAGTHHLGHQTQNQIPNLNLVDLMEFEDDINEDVLIDPDDEQFEEYLYQIRARPRANTTPRPPGLMEPTNALRNRANDRCYRCGELGHYSDGCNRPRRVFCRQCGTPGVRRPECKKCPAFKQAEYCTKCGLIGTATDKCPECAGNQFGDR